MMWRKIVVPLKRHVSQHLSWLGLVVLAVAFRLKPCGRGRSLRGRGRLQIRISSHGRLGKTAYFQMINGLGSNVGDAPVSACRQRGEKSRRTGGIRRAGRHLKSDSAG